MITTAETPARSETLHAHSFGAALAGFLGSTVATTLVLFLLSQV
jgi:hypothetical protein